MNDIRKYKILIVDDEETLRDALVFDFKRRGFTVFSAENAAKAFGIVEENSPDIVISDIRMPGGNGLSLLKKIRERDPDVPVVMFITGFADATEAECLEKGVKKVITKPFDRKVLLEAVYEALGIPLPARAA